VRRWALESYIVVLTFEQVEALLGFADIRMHGARLVGGRHRADAPALGGVGRSGTNGDTESPGQDRHL
jgi:hypothetical protein